MSYNPSFKLFRNKGCDVYNKVYHNVPCKKDTITNDDSCTICVTWEDGSAYTLFCQESNASVDIPSNLKEKIEEIDTVIKPSIEENTNDISILNPSIENMQKNMNDLNTIIVGTIADLDNKLKCVETHKTDIDNNAGNIINLASRINVVEPIVTNNTERLNTNDVTNNNQNEHINILMDLVNMNNTRLENIQPSIDKIDKTTMVVANLTNKPDLLN